MGSSRPSLTAKLAARLAQPVSPEVRERARLHLLDWLACVAGARDSAVASAVAAAESDPLVRAAYLGNLLEMDDVHRTALLHPGPVVWPAALHAARKRDASLGALLDAAVRGYEAMIALGSAFDARHYAFFHNTATAGGFGAAAAAASLYGLGQQQTVSALGNAGSVAGGLWQLRHEPVMTKQWHLAHAVATGVRAARLAQAGFTGPEEILEGPQGLFAATTEQPSFAAVERSRGDWRIVDVSFKPWGACRHAHPAIDAALVLRDQSRLGDAPIVVETYRDALVFCDRPEPASVVEAKFSLQHAVAVVAVRGEPTLSDFEPEAIGDPMIASVRSRVRVAEDAAMTARYPAHFGARVRAGEAYVELRNARGDPERPLDMTGIVAKARDLMTWTGIDTDSIGHTRELVLGASPDTPATEIADLLTAWLR